MIRAMRKGHSPAVETEGPVGISCQGLHKYYDGVRALDEVSLTVEPGQILTVVGPSGCGKTTLLRLLAGFEVPDGGIVSLGDQQVAGPGTWVPPEARRVGMVFQDYALFPHMTVAQNVGFGLRIRDKEERTRRVQELLDMVHLTDLGERRPHHLSGGEQQRVALVRSLAPHPVALFLDEPFSNLDTQLRVELRTEVKAIIRDFGVTTVHVTHDQEEALFMADQIAVMRPGMLEQVGTPEEVFHRPRNRFVAQFMGVADFLSATVTNNGLSSELGSLNGAVSFPVGAQVDVLVRPDQVEVQPSEEGTARVDSWIFRGTHYLYALSLASGTVLHTLQHHTVHYAVGDRVQVSITMSEEPICFEVVGR